MFQVALFSGHTVQYLRRLSEEGVVARVDDTSAGGGGGRAPGLGHCLGLENEGKIVVVET